MFVSKPIIFIIIFSLVYDLDIYIILKRNINNKNYISFYNYYFFLKKYVPIIKEKIEVCHLVM